MTILISSPMVGRGTFEDPVRPEIIDDYAYTNFRMEGRDVLITAPDDVVTQMRNDSKFTEVAR